MSGKAMAGSLEDAPARDMPMLLLYAGLILPPAFLYSLKSDLPHIFVISAAILAAAFFRRRPLPYSDRPIIYCSLLALLLTALPDLLVPMGDDRFGILDIIIRSNLTAPAFLYLAAFSALFESGPQALGIGAALSVAVTLICGDFLAASRLANERTPFLDPLLRNYRTLYVAGVMLQTMFLILAFSTARRISSKGASKKAAAMRLAIKIACVAALPPLAVEGVKLYYANDKLFKSIESYFLRAGMGRRSGRSGAVFGKEVDLNATLSPELAAQRDQIVLRAVSRVAPGYLRGRAYDAYQGGRWSASLEEPVQLAATRRADILSYSSFYLPGYGEGSPAKATADLYPDRSFIADILPLPGSTFAIDVVADKMSMTPNGVFEPAQWRADGGCTARMSGAGQNSAFPLPSGGDMPKAYLELPPELADPAFKLVAEAISGAPPELSGVQGDAGTAAKVAGYLSRAFSYSLSPPPPREGADPVAHFIQTSRKGHCELFASAATIALRSMGIPARYVTGFVCEEAHPSGRYFVARLGNAHAWCEAYLRDQKKWVLVEATPPAALEAAKAKRWGSLEALFDWLKQSFQQAFANVRRGYFAQAILSLLEALIALFWSFVKTPLGIAAIVAALAVLAWRKARRLRTLARSRPLLPETMSALKAELKKIEKGVRPLCKLKREPSMTLDEWVAGCEPACGGALRGIVSQYKSLRYREAPPSPEQVEAFRASAKAFVRTLRSKQA